MITQVTLVLVVGASHAHPPRIVHVGLAAPDIVAIHVEAGSRLTRPLQPYVALPDDERRTYPNPDIPGITDGVEVFRGGRSIGFLAGPNRNWLKPHDELLGELLPLEMVPNRKIDIMPDRGRAPEIRDIWQKHQPLDQVKTPDPKYPMLYRFYVKLGAPLDPRRSYTFDLRKLHPDLRPVRTTRPLTQQWSESIHVNQVGFHPADPSKRAYFSIWLGTGGSYSFTTRPAFRVREARSGRTVHQGTLTLGKAVSDFDNFRSFRNMSSTDVYHMDFDAVTTPGEYLVEVEGVGRSFPFKISASRYASAFRTSMKGFLHQRSGIALGPPFTNYLRPRPMHPEDGAVVRGTGVSFAESFNGFTLGGAGSFRDMVQQMTYEVVPDAWGGYMDAGDWDRHVGHLAATRLQLELVEMFPSNIGQVALALPESERNDAIPDVLNEAMWGVDLYRRLQMPSGAVRGGIESGEHPRHPDTSWLETLPVMAYEPDPYASYVASGVAARLAFNLESRGLVAQAAPYRQMAIRAFQWAEPEMAAFRANPAFTTEQKHPFVDERNLAALELYRLTGEVAYHDVFLQDTVLTTAGRAVFIWGEAIQRDAAFLYARLPAGLGTTALRSRAVEELVKEGEESLFVASQNGWDIAVGSRFAPWHIGLISGARGLVEAIRAHHVSQDPRFLRAIVLGNNFSSGANPMNLVMTTGVGSRSVKHLLHTDSVLTGQPVPDGLTPYGNWDSHDWVNQHSGFTWPYIWVHPFSGTAPTAWVWPGAENYFDYRLHPMTNEYTITQTMGPRAYSWGYLAAVPR